MSLAEVEALVEVDGLSVDFASTEGFASVVRDVSFSLRPGESLGLVGESGCGKTTTALSLLGYRRPNSRIAAGQVRFRGRDVLTLSARELRRIRGRQVALIPQNPATALTPGMRIGNQIEEAMRVHGIGGSRSERADRVHRMLEQVLLPPSARIARKYPHQLSGGQRQRVTIAMALACDPQLLVLDEPTTGLDVTTQAQILELLARLRTELGMAFLYVTHDLGVVAQICDRVGVMYAGQLVEEAPTRELFGNPRHPYTQGLIAAVPSVAAPQRDPVLLRGLLQREKLPQGCLFAPRCDFALTECWIERQSLTTASPDHRVACWRWREVGVPEATAGCERLDRRPAPVVAETPLIDVREIECAYEYIRPTRTARRQPLLAVREVSFYLNPRETFALVGESGSGKSTIARAIDGLLTPLAGRILCGGRDITGDVRTRPQQLRREIQMVFQDPDSSLNPRQRVSQIVGRPLEFYFGLKGESRRRRVEQLLDDVRLEPLFAGRYPDELSGGERQRVAIARALAAQPTVMLCDEVLSALDVSVQANVLELLRALQSEHEIAYLFISHDLAVVRSVAHRVGVLYRGELCEVGPVEDVFSSPFHPYTHMLLSAVPEIDMTQVLLVVHTDPATSTSASRSACPFAHRCPLKVGRVCDDVEPPWQVRREGHAIRCHIPLEELTERTPQPSGRQTVE